MGTHALFTTTLFQKHPERYEKLVSHHRVYQSPLCRKFEVVSSKSASGKKKNCCADCTILQCKNHHSLPQQNLVQNIQWSGTMMTLRSIEILPGVISGSRNSFKPGGTPRAFSEE